jgi:hypothetical protein
MLFSMVSLIQWNARIMDTNRLDLCRNDINHKISKQYGDFSNFKTFFEIWKVAILFRDFIWLDIDKVPRWDENFVILRSVHGVVLQTILDVYNCFTCIVENIHPNLLNRCRSSTNGG